MLNKNDILKVIGASSIFIGGFIVGKITNKKPEAKGSIIVNKSSTNKTELYLQIDKNIDDLCSDQYVILKVVQQKDNFAKA